MREGRGEGRSDHAALVPVPLGNKPREKEAEPDHVPIPQPP